MHLRKFILPSILLIFLIQSVPAKASSLALQPEPLLKTRTGVYRFTFEELTMPNPDERMGILGFDYLFNLTPIIYGGIGGYGAMTGERGQIKSFAGELNSMVIDFSLVFRFAGLERK